MAGHNKWSKIKRKKGAKDVVRAKELGKASKSIEMASRACGGDMTNINLMSAISLAKSAQLPKDRIMDAINRGSAPNKGGDKEMENMRYDGMIQTPGGKIAVIVTALTDNKNRTAAAVRAIMKKTGGDLLATGSNDWLFENAGVVIQTKEGWTDETEELFLESALDGEAFDVDTECDEENAIAKCAPTNLHTLLKALESSGFSDMEFSTKWSVIEDDNCITLDGESSQFFGDVLEMFEDNDDVTEVFHNAL
eukprot:CAMPEP_0116015274 /NCGR_PEP_ID=MMETSP0321-20121206/6745_1 /TAXON_ID=163516 /ORGANISM="Leptocylindrus danicus var. danicus, Strain B650" /LENGTH=250 /DNA_ID=CAMNT_0003485025 /DNA_START=139 /DNA_END=891 /DNA_ORIENTATION=+